MQHLKEEHLGEQTRKSCKGIGGADLAMTVQIAFEENREIMPNNTLNYSPHYKCFGR